MEQDLDRSPHQTEIPTRQEMLGRGFWDVQNVNALKWAEEERERLVADLTAS